VKVDRENSSLGERQHRPLDFATLGLASDLVSDPNFIYASSHFQTLSSPLYIRLHEPSHVLCHLLLLPSSELLPTTTTTKEQNFATMNSSYSPFFTSGFLSQSEDSGFFSPLASPIQEDLGPRRGSLPTNSLHTTRPSTDIDEASAFYFTLQPSRNCSEYRSFLSLDIAESMSLRSVSSRRNTLTCNMSLFPTIAEENTLSVKTLTPRQSRESLRVLPSPKPAPSVTLPPTPQEAASISATIKCHRPSESVPTISSSSSSRPSKRARTQSLSSQTSSVRATRHADALAKLEGRASSTFLSLNDDEDLEPEDIVLPPPRSNPHLSFLSFSSIARRSSRGEKGRLSLFSPLSSFIDLSPHSHERDEERWNWRSFIQFGGV
jgi:hypothetical protein